MEKIKNSRVRSFLVLAFVYLVAAGGGIILYDILPFNVYVNLLIADIFATVLTFIYSLVFQNASVYDPYWSVAPVVVALYGICEAKLNAVSLLIVIAVIIWGIRLTANWAYTFKGLKFQDWRYTMLSEKTGKAYVLVNFLGIHLFPTLVVYGCMVPMVVAFENQLTLGYGTTYFFLTALCAVALQLFSDIQMHKYRKSKASPFIRTGLWKYSRHPNYLGEILMWWSVALMVICAMPSAWYVATGAAINTVMFLVVSIPMADKRQAKKEGFEEYKKETRILFPIKKFTK